MPDLCPLLGFLAFSYGAALTGVTVALLARLFLRRTGRVPTAPEATWCAFLPLLAVLLSPMLAVTEPHAVASFGSWHDLWHEWARTVHATPLLHDGLHVGNALLLGIAAITVARTVYQLARMWSFELALRRVALTECQANDTGAYLRLPSSRPLCFTLGLLRPTVYISDRLLDALTPRDRAAVLAHERAHIRRRDPLVRPLLMLFYSFFLLPGGAVLLRDWSRASERACDAEAGRRVGSRTDVAAALVRAARLMSGAERPEPLLSPFAGEADDIEGRVDALLHPAASGSPSRYFSYGPLLLTAFSVGLLFPVSFWLRHAVEFFVRH
jgi:Zn-dependent protease with chaperone function